MRAIKFRGMFEGVWWYATPEDWEWEQFWAVVDKKTVGQYTGWQDHKRQEVYEGDIVQIGNYRGVIVWDTINDGWRVRVHDTYNLRNNEMVVIGNIYEQPELVNLAET